MEPEDESYLEPKGYGRGALDNPPIRFEEQYHEYEDPDAVQAPTDFSRARTLFYSDVSKTIVTENDSPDVGFRFSINPYRGCEHGCIYCYARPTHEYLGLSAGLDFESKILVKSHAPVLLRKKLSSLSWQPAVLAISGVTDAYQPVERRLRLTRACLEVLSECLNPVFIITKNRLVVRDLDLLKKMALMEAAAVLVSITTLDESLCGKMEPRTSRPRSRLEIISELSRAGIPVGVNVAPVIPGLTDHELPAILTAAKNAGASFAGYTLVRLPLGVAPLFEEWLERHFPDRKQKILHRLEEARGGPGHRNDPRFGTRMTGEGVFAEQVASLFRVASKRAGFSGHSPKLSTQHFKRPRPQTDQLELF